MVRIGRFVEPYRWHIDVYLIFTSKAMTTQEFLDKGFRPVRDGKGNDTAVLMNDVYAKYGTIIIYAVPFDIFVEMRKTWEVSIMVAVGSPALIQKRTWIDHVEEYDKFLSLVEQARNQAELDSLIAAGNAKE